MSWIIVVYLVGTLTGMWLVLRSWRWWLSIKYHYVPRYELCLRFIGDDVRPWDEGGYPLRVPSTWDEISDILAKNQHRIDQYLIIDRWTGQPVASKPVG